MRAQTWDPAPANQWTGDEAESLPLVSERVLQERWAGPE